MFHQENPLHHTPELLGSFESTENELSANEIRALQDNIQLENIGGASSKLWAGGHE